MRIMKVAIIAKTYKKAKQNKSPWGHIAHLNNDGFKWAFNRYRAILPLGRITKKMYFTLIFAYTYFLTLHLYTILFFFYREKEIPTQDIKTKHLVEVHC